MKAPIKGFKLSTYPRGSIVQWYGENEFLYKLRGFAFHPGIDIVAPHGTPIYAVEGGKVTSVKDDPDGYGRHIVIRSGVNEWTYGHFATITVKKGRRVREGQQIGTMGNSGFIVPGGTPFWEYNPFAGTHLHLAVRQRDGNRVLHKDNGVDGAIDPAPYLAEVSLDDEYKNKQLTIISLLNQVVGLYKQMLG